MPYADVNDIHLYYEEAGSGVPLILLHGGTGTIDDPPSSWHDLVPLFSMSYRAIQIEHRGHGRTNNPTDQLTYTVIADDICAFIEQHGLAPAHIAGLSDGGIVALRIGLTRPDLARTLIGVGVNYTVDDQVLAVAEHLDPSVLEREMPGFAADIVRRHDAYHEPGYWRELLRQIVANAKTNPTWTEEDLRRIVTPTLLIAGEGDPFGHLDQMVVKRNIPGAEILIVNNAEHVVQFTHPRIVGPVVMDFLARHPG